MRGGGSGKGIFLIGCGCLSIIALICIGGGGFVYMKVVKPGLDFANECKVLATESPQVKERLGEPIKVVEEVQTQTDNNRMTLRIPVSGSKASGTVVIVAEVGIESGVDFKRQSMVLEVEGEVIDLDPDAATPEVNIKFGDEKGAGENNREQTGETTGSDSVGN